MSLFQQGDFTLHSGAKSFFKIDCDALTDEDWDTIAQIIHRSLAYSCIIGVPRGGLKLMNALIKLGATAGHGPMLIVDDVCTTGKSLEDMKARCDGEVIGCVLFARGSVPLWVYPIFELWPTAWIK